MSRRGRSRSGGQSGSPMSLFPFLSVLICTMGLLILLLVVINRNARTQAAERSGINTAEIIAELEVEAQTLAMFAKDLQKSKEQTIADVENEHAKLASLEKMIGTLELEIQQAEAALKALANNSETNTSETGKLAETLSAKRETQRRAEAELRELRENAANRKSSYAIVPYRGQNGTERRPVYIECRGDCVVIQPEGVVLREDDFLTASHPDNPLDAILRAASLYYTENELVPRGTKPYPLILVRPSGVDAYYAVRESIQSWGEHFGYELVEEDWKLEFPPPNEALKQRLETQLAVSRERMIPIKMMLMQQYREQGAGGREQGAGNRGQGAGSGQGMGTGTGYENVDWRDVMASVGGGEPSGQQQKQNVEYRVGPAGNMVRYVDGVPSQARLQASGFRSQEDASNTNPEVRSPKPEVRPEARSPMPEAFSEPTVMEPGQLYSETMYPETQYPQTQYPQSSSNGSMSGTAETSGEATSGKTNTSAPPQEGDISMSPNLFARQTNETEASVASGNRLPYGLQTSDRLQASGFGLQEDASNTNPEARSPKPEALNIPVQAPNWAMPNVGQGSTEMARPIAVECFPNKMMIRRASGTGIDRTIDIPPNGSVYSVTDTLVSHIVTYIDTWGMAAHGTHWQPEMIVTVQPGTETRYEELKAVMKNSGVRIRRK